MKKSGVGQRRDHHQQQRQIGGNQLAAAAGVAAIQRAGARLRPRPRAVRRGGYRARSARNRRTPVRSRPAIAPAAPRRAVRTAAAGRALQRALQCGMRHRAIRQCARAHAVTVTRANADIPCYDALTVAATRCYGESRVSDLDRPGDDRVAAGQRSDHRDRHGASPTRISTWSPRARIS